MNSTNTPSAGAKLRNAVYLYGGIAIVLALFLAVTGALSVSADSLLYCALMPLTLGADFPHIFAILTGNAKKQEQEKQAFEAEVAHIRYGFRRAHQFWAGNRNHPLREVGAIGMDLTRTPVHASGRQSGAHKQGAGGQRKPASSGSDDDGDGEPPANLPLLWTVHDLARTLSVSAKTLQNKPASALPPAIRIPGCKGPRYRLRDVLAWLDGFPAGQRSARPRLTKAKGRPRIASSTQIAAIRGKGV